ncbi:MAG: PhnD/SsuA/transferrin family substrate-binding protein, partial [Chloroflexi bacterium]|nr:PhnD/SsuA/transferrin family substrate-binding protein [Chloroflexota bacterium]
TGVVFTRPGLGTFVALSADDERLVAERERRLTGILGKALLEALSLGYTLEQIEASFALRLARWQGGPESNLPESKSLPVDTIVAMGSHDLVLDLLAGQLPHRSPSLKMVSTHVGSIGGLMALGQGEAHLAGCHLLDEESGQYNLPYVLRLLPGQHVILINLVYRVQGLMVPRGNPKQIRSVADLARQDVVFVNRQWGSGTRVLLQHLMREAKIAPEQVRGYERELKTHLAVASAVAAGSADVGLGILAAARALELDFIPVVREQYDLVIPRQHYESPLMRPVLDVIGDRSFRGVVAEMGGYDVSTMGQVVGET